MGEKLFVIKDTEQAQHGTSIMPPFGRSIEGPSMVAQPVILVDLYA